MIEWNKERVLVTGGNGFLGRHLVGKLALAGCEDITVRAQKHYDLTRSADTEGLFSCFNPTIVLHLAANVGGIGYNKAHPAQLLSDNLKMAINVVDTAYRYGVKRLISVGTVCSYPSECPVPFSVCDLWSGYPEDTNAPYGIAKRVLVELGRSYRREFGFDAITVIPTNLYGPGDNFDPASSHVIPALIRKFVEAREAGTRFVEVWGSGKASRDFLYVEDCAAGLVRAAEAYDGTAPVNLGGDGEIRIGDLAKRVARACRYDGEIRFDPEMPDGQMRRRVDFSIAQRELGWFPWTSIEKGLKSTVEWFEANRGETK